MKKSTPIKALPGTGSQYQYVTLRLQKRIIEQIDEIAERIGTTRSAQIQTAIAEYVERKRQ